MNDTVGHQAQTIRHRVSTKDGHKSPGAVKFHSRIHLPQTQRQPGRTSSLDDPYGRVIHIEERRSRHRYHLS